MALEKFINSFVDRFVKIGVVQFFVIQLKGRGSESFPSRRPMLLQDSKRDVRKQFTDVSHVDGLLLGICGIICNFCELGETGLVRVAHTVLGVVHPVELLGPIHPFVNGTGRGCVSRAGEKGVRVEGFGSFGSNGGRTAA